MRRARHLSAISAIVAIVAILGLLATACAPAPAPVPTPTTKPTTAPTTAPTPTLTPTASPVSLPTVNWSCQSAWPLTSMTGLDTVAFADRVKEKTGGKFTIKVYAPDTLVKSMETFDAVKKGAVDMSATSSVYWGGNLPCSILESGLPFAAPTYEQNMKMMYASEYMNVLREALAPQNVFYLALMPTAEEIFMTKFPVKTVADLKGKTIRGGGYKADVVKKLGASAVNIAGTEIYTALQRGTIDGTTYSSYALWTYKFSEVVTDITFPGVFNPSITDFIVGMDSWKKLPKQYQDIVQEAADFTAQQRTVQADAMAKEVRDYAASHNVRINNLDKTALADFQKTVVPLWDEWAAKDAQCAKIVNSMKDYLKKQGLLA